MDSHKRCTQVERLEIIETGRRRRWTDDEKLRIVMESLQAPRAISSTARRHGISRSLLVMWRRSFRLEPTGPEAQQARFVPAMVGAAAETVPTRDAAPASGRMVLSSARIVASSLTPASMRPLWRGCCRFWSADDRDSIGQSGLDRDRPYGHETRHAGAGLAGSGGSQA